MKLKHYEKEMISEAFLTGRVYANMDEKDNLIDVRNL